MAGPKQRVNPVANMSFDGFHDVDLVTQKLYQGPVWDPQAGLVASALFTTPAGGEKWFSGTTASRCVGRSQKRYGAVRVIEFRIDRVLFLH